MNNKSEMNKTPSLITRRDFLVTSSIAGVAIGALARSSPVPQSRSLTDWEKPAPNHPVRVIIDTDPGVDDAIALLLAMRSPELKIEGITPVAGNVPLDLTLPNALRMVEVAGRTDIPVAAGAKEPLVRRLITAAYAHGENGLGGAVFPAAKIKPVAQSAAELIREIVRRYPNEVTLITIGPLTNIATALRADPDLAPIIRGLVMMGGTLSRGNITPSAEFNIYVDPEAARVVFQSGIPVTMVGLDVTRKTSLTEEHVRVLEAHNNAVSQAAAKILRSALEHMRTQGYTGGFNMHDSLAVSAFLDPSLLRFEEYYVDVETTGELTAGETVAYGPKLSGATGNSAQPRVLGSAPTLSGATANAVLRDSFVPNARVALDVNSSAFFDLLIGRLSGA